MYVCKIEKKSILFRDLGLSTGDPDVRAFDLGAPFLCLTYNFALLKCLCSFINFLMVLLFNALFLM
jgi:hypothetical protein